MATTFHCKHCSYVSLIWKDLKHAFEAHSAIPGFNFSCQINGCVQTFKKYSSILSHISRSHGGLSQLESDSVTVYSGSDVTNFFDNDNGSHMDELHSQEYDAIATSESSTDGIIQLPELTDMLKCERSAALFLLTLKERHRLTQVGLDFTVEQVQNIISMMTDHLKSSVKNHFEGNNNLHLINIDEIFSFANPFERLQTAYMQNKYFKENFKLVVSEYTSRIRESSFL